MLHDYCLDLAVPQSHSRRGPSSTAMDAMRQLDISYCSLTRIGRPSRLRVDLFSRNMRRRKIQIRLRHSFGAKFCES